jgi:hypothetical protein
MVWGPLAQVGRRWPRTGRITVSNGDPAAVSRAWASAIETAGQAGEDETDNAVSRSGDFYKRKEKGRGRRGCQGGNYPISALPDKITGLFRAGAEWVLNERKNSTSHPEQA